MTRRSGDLGAPLLLLRAFLGVTFCFAGLQKLANPSFFRSSTPGSFSEQLRGAIATSPLHHLLGVALHAPALVAVLISLGELAVGLGTLLGLLARVAAVGGLLLSLTFFLTISFNDRPYYYGADIVFLFAWTPFVLAGAGDLSLDAILARRAATAAAAVRAAATRNSSLSRRRAAELERRVVVERLSVLAGVAILEVVLGSITALVGRLVAPSAPRSSGRQSPASPPANNSGASGSGAPTTTAPTSGSRIGLASAVPVGGAATFTDPSQGVPAFVVQPTAGHFVAFSAVCTHAGCQVEFDQQNETFLCPCHGSVFSATSGAVLSGPAPSSLPAIPVHVGTAGQLYVD